MTIEAGELPVSTKATLLVAGTGWSLTNLPLSQIATCVTILFGVFQLFVLTPKIYATIKWWYNHFRGKPNE